MRNTHRSENSYNWVGTPLASKQKTEEKNQSDVRATSSVKNNTKIRLCVRRTLRFRLQYSNNCNLADFYVDYWMTKILVFFSCSFLYLFSFSSELTVSRDFFPHTRAIFLFLTLTPSKFRFSVVSAFSRLVQEVYTIHSIIRYNQLYPRSKRRCSFSILRG